MQDIVDSRAGFRMTPSDLDIKIMKPTGPLSIDEERNRGIGAIRKGGGGRARSNCPYPGRVGEVA
jgi:hypothetical protein